MYSNYQRRKWAGICLTYSQRLIEKIKTVEGRRWHPVEKHWSIPGDNQTIHHLAKVLKGEKITADPVLNSFFATVIDASIGNLNFTEQIAEESARELKIRGYSPKTCKNYLWHIKQFVSFYSQHPKDLGDMEIKQYMLHLLEQEKASHSFVTQAVSAVKFLFKVVLHQTKVTAKLPRPKAEKKLPDVLSQQEVARLLEQLQNLKHRAILLNLKKKKALPTKILCYAISVLLLII